jgi:hypothetical protein
MKRAGIPTWRAPAMKACAKSCDMPFRAAKAATALAAAVPWVAGISVIASCRAVFSACRRASVSAPAASTAACAKSPSASSARVIAVSRRNSDGGNRSTVPRITPAVSWVSTSPSTVTAMRSTGPDTDRPWMMLANASSPGFRRESVSTSMRQCTTNCPS